MVKRVTINGKDIPQQVKELVDEIGMDEEQLVDILKGTTPQSVIERIVEFRDTPQGGICGDLLIESFEYFNVYAKYTQEVRAQEEAIAKAMQEAADKAERENFWHRLAAQENIALNKESAKILKGGC